MIVLVVLLMLVVGSFALWVAWEGIPKPKRREIKPRRKPLRADYKSRDRSQNRSKFGS